MEEFGARHPIRVVCRRTGLKPDVVRAWERRYAAVLPARTDTDRRLYTDADIERLQLLRRAVQNGRSIGQIARLDAAALTALIAGDSDLGTPQSVVAPATTSSSATSGSASSFHHARALEAVYHLDAAGLLRQFELASVDLSRRQLIEEVIVPLMHELGHRWRAGDIQPAHEHLASSVVRTFIGGLVESGRPQLMAPRVVVSTPARQLHEIGALVAAATAVGEGWAATYLGPNLPAADIALAAEKLGVRAIVLSLTFPDGDSELAAELRLLRQLVGGRVAIVVGGRVVDDYAAPLDEIGARRVYDLAGLRLALSQVRTE
jgi:DNA-binding transcriptional MerR regulator/methylmalonyl-CoA mutase cobalamin-binding subunit